MIKFFRHIRKSLLMENKTGKYFKYAIGEIILVVIGILIALQINNWNEIKKLESKESAILHSLLDDLHLAKEQSENYIKNEEKALNYLEIALKSKSERAIITNPKFADSIFYFILWNFEIDVPIINTYSDIKSAGETDQISNIQIRNGFTSLELTLNNLNNLMDDRLSVHQVRIDNIVVDEINFLKLLKAGNPTMNIDTGIENNYDELLDKQKVRNLIGLKTELTISVLNMRYKLDEDISNLISLIDSELNSL